MCQGKGSVQWPPGQATFCGAHSPCLSRSFCSCYLPERTAPWRPAGAITLADSGGGTEWTFSAHCYNKTPQTGSPPTTELCCSLFLRREARAQGAGPWVRPCARLQTCCTLTWWRGLPYQGTNPVDGGSTLMTWSPPSDLLIPSHWTPGSQQKNLGHTNIQTVACPKGLWGAVLQGWPCCASLLPVSLIKPSALSAGPGHPSLWSVATK